MAKHMLASGLIAGFIVALLVTVLQFFLQEDHILLAERYETGELTHFAAASDGHSHETSTETAEDGHAHGAAADESFVLRQGKTMLAAIVTYCGFGLVMVAGFATANHFGHKIPLAHGLLWGLAGFAAAQMAPALGLTPGLPGSAAAALEERQMWWFGCALATAGGLAMLAYGQGLMPRLAGVVLLVLPHLIGAPQPDGFAGGVPPELAASFAARSLGVGLVAWVTLGGVLSRLWDRTA